MLLGFPAGVPEAGQRGSETHPAPSGALDGFLQLLEDRKTTREAAHWANWLKMNSGRLAEPNESARKSSASCDRTSAHAVRSLQLVSLEQPRTTTMQKRGKKTTTNVPLSAPRHPPASRCW